MNDSPILISIDEAAERIGQCRRTVYQLIADDRIQAVKAGRSTRIVFESLKQYAATLPPAKIKRSPKWRAEGLNAIDG
jgi:excisionase family DNA binding protein